MNKIRILLVDDHRLMREGIAAMLQGLENVEIVGSVSSGEAAMNLIDEVKPNIILMDIHMGGMTGIEATRWIKEQNPGISIILISMEVNQELISAGIKAGISGYVPKDTDKDILIEALHAVSKGEKYFSPEVTALIFEEFYSKEKDGKSSTKKKSTELSKREEEVLILIANGKKTREVADELFISVKTVETHKQHILDKLGLTNTVQLVRYAIENDFVEISKSKKDK